MLLDGLKNNTNDVILNHLNEENAMELLGGYLSMACW